MNMTKTLAKQLSQIQGFDANDHMRKQYLWATHYQSREEVLKGLREEGFKGSEYSDAVVAFDSAFVNKSMFN